MNNITKNVQAKAVQAKTTNKLRQKLTPSKYFVLFTLTLLLIIITLIKKPNIRNELLLRGSEPKNAIAVFDSRCPYNKNINGDVVFKESCGNTKITVNLTGLSPGKHGFHIHEFGNLSNGCQTTGDHYNPTKRKHGDIIDGHMGDLGNITADSEGNASVEIISNRIRLTGKHSIIGRSLIIHSDEDDLGKGYNLESTKTGNSGARIACAIIGVNKK